MTNPLTQEPTFLIPSALASNSRHGYGITTNVERTSSGRVRLRAGTFPAPARR